MRIRLALLMALNTVVSFDCSVSMSGSRAIRRLLHLSGAGLVQRESVEFRCTYATTADLGNASVGNIDFANHAESDGMLRVTAC